MHDRTVRLLSIAHTTVFRATKGLIGRRLVNNDMLLLTTVGRSSGTNHTVPLLYLEDDENFIVIASYGGRPTDPDWYRNLLVNPRGSVQIRGMVSGVEAEMLSAEERSEWWPRIVSAHGDYEAYQSRTERVIPVVRLRTIS